MAGGKSSQDDLVIQCAEIIRGRLAVIRDYRFLLLLAIFMVMIISAAGACFVIRTAGKPLQKISPKVGRMSEADLSERIHLENILAGLKVLSASFIIPSISWRVPLSDKPIHLRRGP